MKKNTVKLSESQLRGIIAESVRKVLSERYLEPGTADYETDKIAKDLKRSYPQYESFVDEYVYGGYYEQYARMSGGYFCVREGFREFVKKKQHGNIAEGVKKVLGENTVDEKRFLPILKKTYNNLHSEYERWQYAKYKPQGMDKAIDAIIDAMFEIKEIIERIEPLPEEPHLEDY